jgi:glutathione S-transferase
MKLYAGPLSLFSAKVRVALDEKGLAFDEVSVGWSLQHRYEPHHPDVAALNPKGQVPVLVDGDVVVYDSTQIFEYLEDRSPEPPLYPRDAGGRARCRRLEAAADELLFPSVWSLIEEAFYPAGAAGRDDTRLERARAALVGQYVGLDKELTGRAWLCHEFSVADIATFILVQAASSIGAAPTAEHGALRAWTSRMLARPAVSREVDAMNRFAARTLAARTTDRPAR